MRWSVKLLFLFVISGMQSLALGAETVVAQPAWQVFEFSGFTRARHTLDLSSEVAGRVETVNADVGDAIPDSGQFACLDTTLTDLELEASRVEQERLRAEIRYYEKQRERLKRLVSSNSSAQSQLDDTERSVEVFTQQLKQAQVQTRQIRERLKRHCVPAPSGWLVMERTVEPLQWLNPGQTIARVGDFSELLIPFALTQAELAALQSRQSVQISFPEIGITAQANIEHIAPGFDQVSRKRRVDLVVEARPAEKLASGGLRAVLKIRLPDSAGAYLLPVQAVKERYEEYWLTREAGAQLRVVYLGTIMQQGQEFARVVSPEIQAGDRFVIED